MRQYFTTHEMREFLKVDPDEAMSTSHEDTFHINHEACHDTRSRLYITRRDGRHLFYCHNCGKRGSYADDAANTVRRPKYTRVERDDDMTVHLPDLKNGLVNSKVVVNLNRYLPEFMLTYPIAYNMFRWSGGKCYVTMSNTSLAMDSIQPIVHWMTGPKQVLDEIPESPCSLKYSGVQLWLVDETSRMFEKWKSKTSHGRMVPALFYDMLNGPNDDLLVITEDPVSAMCVTGHGANALCLFGSNLSPIALSEYAALYNKVLVWLDYDSSQNRHKATEFARTAGLFCSNAYDAISLLNEDKLRYQSRNKDGHLKHDPKNYQPEYLAEVLNKIKSGF